MEAGVESEFDSGDESYDTAGRDRVEQEDDSGDESYDTAGRDNVEPEDEFQFDVLTREEIAQHMVDRIKDVNTIVEIPPTITRILLNQLKWDSEKLYEKYFDGDKESLFMEAHIVNSQQETNASSSKPAEIPPTITRILLSNRKWIPAKICNWYFDGDKESHSREAHVVNSQQETNASCSKPAEVSPSKKSWLKECKICLRDMPNFMMTGLICGDCFCSECWTIYLTTKIMDEGNVQQLTCAAQTCDTVVEDQIVMNLIKDASVKSKYQHLIINNFVACNPLVKWCPQPGCNNAIRAFCVHARPVVTCKCGHTFCFSCTRNWHDPVKCSLLEKWEKKYEDEGQEENYNASECDDDDSETSNRIEANIKECPKCNVTIEKDGGCNHMICNNQSCKFHFCWLCLRPWNSDGCTWYDCNRYDDEVAKTARDAQERSQAAHQGYQFYCNRYRNHMTSLMFETELYASVKEMMKEMQRHNMSWIEVQFLKEAVDVLCQCRQTLMYTYVFAYYLEKNNQSAIFEHNQRDLENATEQLSGFLERNITAENVLFIRQNVLNKYRYCESRRQTLLKHVHEGYDKDFWEYSEEISGKSSEEIVANRK